MNTPSAEHNDEKESAVKLLKKLKYALLTWIILFVIFLASYWIWPALF